jgi:hypothetical protein
VLQRQIEGIHTEGRNRPPVEASLQTEFATSWGTQFVELLKREALFRWRDPTYLIAKLALNIAGGLLIGVRLSATVLSSQLINVQIVHILASKGQPTGNSKQAFRE